MKVVCSHSEVYLKSRKDADLCVLLYNRPIDKRIASCGSAIQRYFQRNKFYLSTEAWDFLSLALAVVSCDLGVKRRNSPDGWTRIINLEVTVNNPEKYNENRKLIEDFLSFLSTDIWKITFLRNGFSEVIAHPRPKLKASCISLISGGLDSLVGAIDLVSDGESPFFVSQIVPGDRQKQIDFVKSLKGQFEHLQINHSFRSPLGLEPSQRARSIIFLSYGVIASTLVTKSSKHKKIKLYVCENGLISINAPLTEARLGSLSTRTTHPYFLSKFQNLIDALGFHLEIENPYQFRTKGQMLSKCKNQILLKRFAHLSTSCGRYARNGYNHCGRCVPCLIRRASFIAWGVKDRSGYIYKNLGLNDQQHAAFDDVRSAAVALHTIKTKGFNQWIGSSLAALPEKKKGKLRSVVKAGMKELKLLLAPYKLY